MANITELLAIHFDREDDPRLLCSSLLIGTARAGQMAQIIYELAVFPPEKIDEDAVAAASLSLLSLLAHVEQAVERLEAALKTAGAEPRRHARQAS